MAQKIKEEYAKEIKTLKGLIEEWINFPASTFKEDVEQFDLSVERLFCGLPDVEYKPNKELFPNKTALLKTMRETVKHLQKQKVL